jgi:hypothetical protein
MSSSLVVATCPARLRAIRTLQEHDLPRASTAVDKALSAFPF